MRKSHGFVLMWEKEVEELKSVARLWKHERTGAQLLSCVNADENKVFGVSFRTPPKDSTGVAHILEHSVLCGSKKYPVKEPFVELLKGSLQTFLNAFTFPDKTCYPVASTNLQDFYNLIDVYLDAVFHPNITERTLRQEGWHIEATSVSEPLTYKGVVYNEMKGVYSSPDSLLGEASQQSLFPDTTYGLDSGGDPEVILSLTYDAFKNFHETYYHPSNARFYFWGDDPEEARLEKLNQVLQEFTVREVDSAVATQPRFSKPREVEIPYAADPDEAAPKAMVTVNWLFAPTAKTELTLAFQMLDHILTGLPGSPLRRALIESGLGEDIAGGGLECDLKETFYSIGLKGLKPEDADKVQTLIFDTLTALVDDGIPGDAVEAAINSVEFSLRENNTGRFPVGLAVMIRSLSTWLYDESPLGLLAFEDSLRSIKARVARKEQFFEGLIQEWMIENTHRSVVRLTPDKDLQARREKAEADRLAEVKSGLTRTRMEELITETEELRKAQEAPDSPEALAAIPRLGVADLPRENRIIPLEERRADGIPLFAHALPCSDIVYTELAFDMTPLIGGASRLVPLVPLFGRTLLEMGSKRRDFAELGMYIARKTGGMDTDLLFLTGRESGHPAFLVVSGKATMEKYEEFSEILGEVLLESKAMDRGRFRQMLLEEKARKEQQLVPAGHSVVSLRLRAALSPAACLAEATDGVNYLDSLRALAERVENNWNSVREDLEEIRRLLVCRQGLLLNVTADPENMSEVNRHLGMFAQTLPASGYDSVPPNAVSAFAREFEFPKGEALIVPSQVNYIGKGANLYSLGYRYHGSVHVIMKHLRMAWLWDRVRVQGGAYGAFCAFERFSGAYTQVSYRDPNVENTLKIYDRTAAYLRKLSLSSADLESCIVGAIGELDAYLLPDAKGMASFARHLTGDTEEVRRKMRDEILSTSVKHFHEFADVLDEAAAKGRIVMLGGSAVEEYAKSAGLDIRKA